MIVSVRRHPRLLVYLGAIIAALLTAWLLWHPLLTDPGSVRVVSMSRPFFPLPRGAAYAVRAPELVLEGVPLAEAIDQLQTITGQRIVIDWPTLEAARVPRDTTTFIRSRGLKLGDVLDLLLQTTSKHEYPDLTHHLGADGVIHISTTEAFAGYRQTGELYILNEAVAPHFAWRPTRQKLETGGAPSWFERWGIDAFLRPGPADSAVRTDRIVEEIARTIDPTSWDDPGRPSGNLFAHGTPGVNGTLTVTQAAENHRRVAELLNGHRRQAALAAFAGRTVVLVGVVLAVTALGMACRRVFFRPRRAGFCAACGYDLRATPERCPECGVMPAG